MSDHRCQIIDVLIQAGRWPKESDLKAMSGNAVDAISKVVETTILDRCEISLVFTDDKEITKLNAQWRGKNQPTNVLSFPQMTNGGQDLQDSIDAEGAQAAQMLGDIVLAAETVAREATLAQKPLNHHIVHLIIHGVLHLIGYDHLNERDAERMEEVERRALAQLDIPDPYIT